MKYKPIIYVAIIILILIITLKSALSIDDTNYSISYQGRISDLNNNSIPSSSMIQVIINDSSGTTLVNDSQLAEFFFGDNSGFDRTWTDLSLIYNQDYFVCLTISGNPLDCYRFKSHIGLITSSSIKDGTIQYSDLNMSEISAFGIIVGTTSTFYDGSMTNGSDIGYVAANAICNQQISGSHFCLESEVVKSISLGYYNYTGTYWMSKGAPGYTANADDCQGWTSNTNTYLGPFWNWDGNAQAGYGRLTNCAQTKQLMCCKG